MNQKLIRNLDRSV